jgi:hypothetical protein
MTTPPPRLDRAALEAALAEGRGAEILPTLRARRAEAPDNPWLAAVEVEATLQAGDANAALTLLAEAMARHPGLPRLGAAARKAFLALTAERRMPEAHRAFALMRDPPEPLRLRHALALLEAGMAGPAAEVAAGLRDAETRSRAVTRVAQALRERPQAALVLLALASAGAWSGEPLRLLCGALAQAGEAAAARELLARSVVADAAEAIFCEAVLLRGEGELASARRRIAPLLASPEPRLDVLMAAHDWAWEALDLAEATNLAERLVRSGRLADSFAFTRLLAKLLAEQGRHAAAWEAMAALRRDLAHCAAPDAATAGAGEATSVALGLLDFDAARALAERLPPAATARKRMAAVAWSRRADGPTDRFVARAARAWAEPDAAMADARTADVVFVQPSGVLPSIDLTRSPDGGFAPAGEQGMCHYAMARALHLAEAAGLTTAIVPSPGYAVPPEVIAACRFFVSYHSFSAPGAGVHVKGGPLPNTVLMDPAGYSGWTSACALELSDLPLAAVPAETAAAWVERERGRLAAGNVSKWAQRPRGAGTAPSGPAVLVALQIPDDNALRHAWVDMFDLARAVVTRFRGSGATVVVKRHPHCRDPRTDALLRELRGEAHVLVSDASIHDLLPTVQAVYCVNSGVGAEALLYGRAVHVAGMVDYRHACHEIRSLDRLLAGEAAFRPPLAEAELVRYVYWFRNIHHVPLDVPGALDAAIAERIIAPARALGTRR